MSNNKKAKAITQVIAELEGFEETAVIDVMKGKTKIIPNPSVNVTDKRIYAWLEHNSTSEGPAEVVYVGKASNMKARMGQHSGGFYNSHTGMKHRQNIESGLRQGKLYSIVSRPIKGYSGSIDEQEQMYIDAFQPRWNTVGKCRAS